MLKCEVIQDLLPLYLDDCCSGESKRLVEEHLKECPACRRMCENMKKNLCLDEEEQTENLKERELLESGKEVLMQVIRYENFRKMLWADILFNFLFIAVCFLAESSTVEISENIRWFLEYGLCDSTLLVFGVYPVMNLLLELIPLIKKPEGDHIWYHYVIVSLYFKSLSVFLIILFSGWMIGGIAGGIPGGIR